VERRLCFAVLYRDVVTDSERLFEDALNQLAPLPQVLGPPILRRQRRNKAMRGSAPSSSGVQFSSLSVPEVSPGGSKFSGLRAIVQESNPWRSTCTIVGMAARCSSPEALDL